jgi:riboflavin biosynthesis pyrimidine reductase
MNLPRDVSVLPCLCSANGSLNINDVLKQLRSRYCIRTVMVEGGAATLSSFFSANVVDALVITIAPKLLHRGIAPKYIVGLKQDSMSDVVDLSKLLSRFIVLGCDTVLVSRYCDTARTQM